MENMDRWDLAFLVVGGYVAILALTRLMARHRDHLLGRLRQRMEQQKQLQRKQEQERENEQRAASRQRRAG
jgi:hypothetical protein